MKAGRTTCVMRKACNMTLESHVIHTFNQEHLMLAVLATVASLLGFSWLAGVKACISCCPSGPWGCLWPLTLGSGTISQGEAWTSKGRIQIWRSRCRSMTKEEKVSIHGLHLLKVVKTYKVFIWTGKVQICWTNIQWRILFHCCIPLLSPQSCFSAFSLPLFPFRPPALLFSSQAVLIWQLSLWTTGKIDSSFVFLIAIDVLEVYHHVQSIG